MLPSPSPPEFFLDRSLGRHTVADILRTAGWTLHTHHEVFGLRDETIEDVEWLEHAGRNGLVVLTKDRRLRYRPAEIAAIRRFRVRAFALTRGQLTATEQAKRFLANADRIRELAHEPAPFLYAVHTGRLERMYP